MSEIYEIRTMRGTRVHVFDDEVRARQAMLENEKRVGIKMQLFRITKREEKLA